MKSLALGFVAFAASACVQHGAFPPSVEEDVKLVPPNGRVEFAVDEDGKVLEVEFHCDAGSVPEVARKAVDAAVPGGQIVDAEKEYVDGEVYYEITKVIDGREREVMVTESGKVHSHEIDVAENKVPPAVLRAVEQAFPGSRRTKTEEIRDGEYELVEYHVKVDDGGRRLKVVLSSEGRILHAVRETLAEIEIPVKVGG